MSILISLIDKQQQLLEEVGLDTVARNLRIAQSRFKEDDFRILVAGEFSRGKSTFINALIGEEVLAASLLRLPVVNLVKGGKEKTVRAGQPGSLEEIAIQDISEQQEASRVELTWDAPFLREGVELLEYPSMSEAPDEQAFRSEVENADLVVVVVASDSLYSRVEADAVEQVIQPSGHRKLLFIANIFDRIAEKDREEVKRAAFVRLPVNKDRIFFVSAQNALDGEKEWQYGIEAARNKIREEAANRKALKMARLRQLVKEGLEKIEEQQEQSEQSNSEAAAGAKAKIAAIRKNLQGLQGLNNRIQHDLLSFRNGTRDVLHEKIGLFNRELASNVESWGMAYQGDELAGHLNEKLKQAVLKFSEQDFAAYFQKRLKEQEELLDNSFTRYQQQLNYLYGLLPEEPPKITVGLEGVELKPGIGQVEISERQSSGASILGSFNLHSLREAPEAMLSLAGAIVGSILFSQFALFLIPAGLGAATLFLSRKGRMRSKRESLKAYADQIRKKSGQWEAKVIEQVNVEIDRMQSRIFALFNETTQAAQEAAQAHTSSLHREGSQTQQSEVQSLVEQIREALNE